MVGKRKEITAIRPKKSRLVRIQAFERRALMGVWFQNQLPRSRAYWVWLNKASARKK